MKLYTFKIKRRHLFLETAKPPVFFEIALRGSNNILKVHVTIPRTCNQRNCLLRSETWTRKRCGLGVIKWYDGFLRKSNNLLTREFARKDVHLSILEFRQLSRWNRVKVAILVKIMDDCYTIYFGSLTFTWTKSKLAICITLNTLFPSPINHNNTQNAISSRGIRSYFISTWKQHGKVIYCCCKTR